jgi:hypothetical protein
MIDRGTVFFRRWRNVATLFLASWFALGCAGYAGTDLLIGTSSTADVVASMGEPAMRWQEPDGSVQLAYPRGPEGMQTFMVFIAPDGRVRAIENVLTERHFAKIVPGATQDEVLRLIGPPAPQWTAYFAARNELVWEWRYCDGGNITAKLDVLFDGTTKQVRTTYSRQDYRGKDGIAPACGHVPGR